MRTAELNIGGRLALLGSCVAGAVVGFAVGRVLGLPAAVAASAVGLIPVAIVAALDRRRWRAMLAGYGWGGTAAEVSEVIADLARHGVEAHVQLNGDGRSASLRYRHADSAVVSTVLADRGVPGVPHPR